MLKLYNEVIERIKKLDFEKLWPGFKPFRFAIYNDKEVCLDGEMIEKDQRFFANSAIDYNGEQIAIWNIAFSPISNPNILASKIVHEMFHAYQQTNNEKRVPNEFKALDYQYTAENISIKHKENNLIVSLLNEFDQNQFNELIQLRKYREQNYQNEFEYETKVEVFEGMAEYVEMKALKELDEEEYLNLLDRLKKKISEYKNLIPIRMVSYNIGALILLICDKNGISVEHEVGKTDKTIYDIISSDIQYKTIDIEIKPEIEEMVTNYYKKRETTVKEFIAKATNKIEGEYPMIGFDPLNSFKYKEYLYCKYLVAYMDGDERKILQQETVVKVNEKMMITEIFY